MGVLEFVLWMQVPDGRWLNFVYDWRGTRNQAGITSSTGRTSGTPEPWQA